MIHAMTLTLYVGSVRMNLDISPFLFMPLPLVIIGIITIRSGVALDKRYVACYRREDPNNGYGAAVTGNFLAAVGLVGFYCLITLCLSLTSR